MTGSATKQSTFLVGKDALHGSTKTRHTPRMRGIQYAAASRFHHDRLGVLDHPLSRVMTVRRVGKAQACPPSSFALTDSIFKQPSCHCEPTGRANARPMTGSATKQSTFLVGKGALHGSTKTRHTPRMRGIQYAAASRFHHDRLGVPDHPLSRVMTVRRVGKAQACPPSSFALTDSIFKQPSCHCKQ
jgi:hypothetical protein